LSYYHSMNLNFEVHYILMVHFYKANLSIVKTKMSTS
jgi:hypothetical protein